MIVVPAKADMHTIEGFAIDRTEVSIAQFQRFAEATGFVSQAERSGGGEVYGWGWEQKPGWTWQRPFGVESDPRLPAVHLTFDEATAYCAWRGARLPTEIEWRQAAYVEHRSDAGPDFIQGQDYPYPTGDSPLGANCLSECGFIRRSVFVMSWIAGSVRLRLVPRSKGSTVCMTWERMCGSGSTVSRSIPKSPLAGVGGMRPFGCIETIEQSNQETLPWCISDFAARQMCAKSRDLDLV